MQRYFAPADLLLIQVSIIISMYKIGCFTELFGPWPVHINENKYFAKSDKLIAFHFKFSLSSIYIRYGHIQKLLLLLVRNSEVLNGRVCIQIK